MTLLLFFFCNIVTNLVKNHNHKFLFFILNKLRHQLCSMRVCECIVWPLIKKLRRSNLDLGKYFYLLQKNLFTHLFDTTSAGSFSQCVCVSCLREKKEFNLIEVNWSQRWSGIWGDAEKFEKNKKTRKIGILRQSRHQKLQLIE